MKLSGNKGLTLIETIATATILTFVTLGVINLLSRVYQGIVSMQLKTTAYENVSDNIDKFKRLGFAALQTKLNPSTLYTYAAIKAGGASTWYETDTIGNTVFEVYRIIQYAQENQDGDIVPIPPSTGTQSNIIMLTVHIQYLDKSSNTVKSTERMSFIANYEVPSVGSSIAGTLSAASGPALGLANNPIVYVTGHPELTTSGVLSGGAITYLIKDLEPGKYSLWAEASGYVPTTYTSNPVSITNTVQAVSGINIALAPADTGILTGVAYYERLIPQLSAPYKGIPASVTLTATGLFNGAVPVNTLWTHTVTPTGDAQMGLAIGNTNDAKVAITVDHTSANVLTTEFTDTDQTDSPIMVEFNLLYSALGVGGTDKVRVYFSKAATGSPIWSNFWNIQPNTWLLANTTDVDTTAPNNYYTDITMINGSNLSTTDITTLYDEGSLSQWTPAQVNSLCVRLTAIGTNFTNLSVDGIYLKLHYPGAKVDNVNISATDGLSNGTMTDSLGRFTLANIKTGPGAATNTITAYALKPNLASPPYICTRANLIEAKGQTKSVNFILIQAAAGTGTITGKVVNSTTNLGISGATVVYTNDADSSTYSTTSDANGNFTLSPVPTGTGTLSATISNYIQTSSGAITVGPFTPNQNITMKPTGKISGRVTNNTTTAGVDGIQVKANNSAGGGDAIADTSGGGYYTVTVTAGDTYSVQTVLSGSQYKCVYPATSGNKCININVGTGTSVSNQNFKIDYSYNSISGTVSISNPTGVNTLITNGAIVIAQPVGNTIPAQGISGTYFSSLSDGDEQNTYFRTIDPSFTASIQQDGTYTVSVPVNGSNYDLYAYYTYTSTTTTITNPGVFPPKYQKIRTNYYQKISAQAPGSTGVNFTGSWTVY